MRICHHGHEQTRLGIIRDPVPSLGSPGVAPIRALVEAGVAGDVDILRVKGVHKNLPHVPGTIDRQEGPVAIDPLRAGERRVDPQRIDPGDVHRGAGQGRQPVDLGSPVRTAVGGLLQADRVIGDVHGLGVARVEQERAVPIPGRWAERVPDRAAVARVKPRDVDRGVAGERQRI